MQKEIVNRVANSKLITIDLEDYYPIGNRIQIDIKDWLFEGFILKEAAFRAALKKHDWAQYKNCYVAMHCSTDAIIPSWAYLLITTYVSPFSKKTVVGSLNDLETAVFNNIINKLDFAVFQEKAVIIKGCSSKPIPQTAYIHLIEKLQPFVKSLMYGEACSTVPLYKVKK